MQLGKIVKALLFVVGLALALEGAGILAMALAGQVITGRSSAYAVSGALLLLAAPCLVLLFSVRAARILGSFVLLMFAFGALWLAFGAATQPKHPWPFRAVAVAFVVLVISRVGLSLRNAGSARRT